MSCTLAAGQSLRWLRDTCCAGEVAEAAKQGVDPYELMTALAEKTPIGADGLLFLPYLMGERSPLLDEKARGAFIGLSGGHGRGHLIRAVLEGVTYSQRQCVDVLRGMNVPTEEMMACGGGARSAFWRQMLADVYGCPAGRGYSGRCWHRCVSLRGERLRCHRQAGYRSVPRCGMWPRL